VSTRNRQSDCQWPTEPERGDGGKKSLPEEQALHQARRGNDESADD
jgi:hypothetical protein